MALNEFVQTALDEEGYEEGSDGYTKYGSFWCWMRKIISFLIYRVLAC